MPTAYYKAFPLVVIDTAGGLHYAPSETINAYNVTQAASLGTLVSDADGVIASGSFTGVAVGDVVRFYHSTYPGEMRLTLRATADESYTDPESTATSLILENQMSTTTASQAVQVWLADTAQPDVKPIYLGNAKSGTTTLFPYQSNVGIAGRVYAVSQDELGRLSTLDLAYADFDNVTIPATAVTAFTDLSDAPSTYASQSLKAVRVNVGETALEFYTPSGGLTIGNAVSGGGANRVLYEDGSQNLAASASLTFDGTTFSSLAHRFTGGSTASSATQNHVTIGGGGSSPVAGTLSFGNNAGWKFDIGTDVGGTFTSRVRFHDAGEVGIGTTATYTGVLLTVNGPIAMLNGYGTLSGQPATPTLFGAAGANSPNAGGIAFGDGTGWKYHFGHQSGGTFNPFITFLDTTALGIGTTSPSAGLHVIKTTVQSRIGYDASNYYDTTVGSTGGVTFDAVGSGAAFTFSDAVTINGALTLSAQNIVTDTTTGMKIGTGTTQKLGFFNATPVTQRTNIGATTDSTTGTSGASVDDVGGAFDQGTLNDNFATIVNRLNAIEQVFQDLGLTA